MKIRELILELQNLARSNPEADLRFESVEYLGNGTCSTEAGFVDAKSTGDSITIRLAVPPFQVENIRRCNKT